MKFELLYEVEDHGWANATIKARGEACHIDGISYLSDALYDLCDAVLRLLKGGADEQCAFEHEPGRSKLRFVRAGNDVNVAVYQFERELRDEPWENGIVAFEASVALPRLKSQLLAACDRIIEDKGLAGYEEAWGSPFPSLHYEAIKNS